MLIILFSRSIYNCILWSDREVAFFAKKTTIMPRPHHSLLERRFIRPLQFSQDEIKVKKIMTLEIAKRVTKRIGEWYPQDPFEQQIGFLHP